MLDKSSLLPGITQIDEHTAVDRVECYCCCCSSTATTGTGPEAHTTPPRYILLCPESEQSCFAACSHVMQQHNIIHAGTGLNTGLHTNGSIWPTRNTSTGLANAHQVPHEVWQLRSFLGPVSYDDTHCCGKHFVMFITFSHHKKQSPDKLQVSH